MYPNRHAHNHQQNNVKNHAANSDAETFFELLNDPELQAQLDSLLPSHRKRVFPPKKHCRCF
jgi:hypothetical protein